jgi:hypothetical protein
VPIGKEENRRGDRFLSKALEIHPKFPEAHYSLAVAIMKQEFKLAIEHCDEAGKLGISVDPTFLERLKPYR